MVKHTSTIIQEKENGLSTHFQEFAEVEYAPEEVRHTEGANADATVLPEADVVSEERRFLVDQYFRMPDQNTLIAGRNGFRSINKWEGIVSEIFEEEGSFSAILTDLNNDGPKEEVTLSFEEVSEEDMALLKPGAIFYWNIGYEKTHGQVKKASIIRFKRLPEWTEKDWDQIMDKANELEKGIEWE